MKRDSINEYVHMRYDTHPPLYAPVHFDDSPPSTYLMDSLFLKQKTNKNIRISYSLKYKHSKNVG